MSATMSDDLKVPFTIIKQVNQESVENKNQHSQWEISYKDNTLLFQVENIKLMQAPSELLNLRVEIAQERNTNGYSHQFTTRGSSGEYIIADFYRYHIELHFRNYLHEFNKNYSYEILCKIYNSYLQKDEYLFTCTEIRSSECVRSVKRFLTSVNRNLTSSAEYNNMYFCIRRRFDGCNDIRDKRIHTAISTFRNTGCDVVLGTKDGDVRTHKSVLSQNSEVFQAMFAVEMKEKQSGIIDVSDFDKRVVNKMLDYLYTGQIGELEDVTEALFKLAHRYQLHDLCRLCEEYYTFNVKVDNDNIVKILQLTDLYELKNLHECAVNFAKSHEQELITVSGYREYLIQSINSDNVVAMLLLSEKYGLKDVRMESFDYVKENYHELMKNQDFLNLFVSHGELMRDLHVYVHQK